jgi:hypothetical protein
MYLMNDDYPDVEMTIVWLVSLKNKQKLAIWFCSLFLKLINQSNEFLNEEINLYHVMLIWNS